MNKIYTYTRTQTYSHTHFGGASFGQNKILSKKRNKVNLDDI